MAPRTWFWKVSGGFPVAPKSRLDASLLIVLILAATPIGNLGDASDRLRQTIGAAELIACEDTRVLRQLMSGLGISSSAKLVSLHEHNERAQLQQLVAAAQAADVVLVSDAGMPTISDPGFALVRAAIEAGVEVTIVPGPSAVLSALAISGLPTDRFSFEGFLPRKSGERRAAFEKLRSADRTLIFFESPHRIAGSIDDAIEVFGPERSGVVVRELTKKFEEVARGSLEELRIWSEKEPKGELVMLIAPAPQASMDYQRLAQSALELSRKGLSLKDACAAVAELAGGSKNVIYEHALEQKA